MLTSKPECYYRHRDTGCRMSIAEFHFKCPYAEMEQWECCWPDGRPWTKEDEARVMDALVGYWKAITQQAEKDSD